MQPPAPVPPGPGPAAAGPAGVAAALARHLTARGITGIYTATTDKFAVISVTADLTVWTNGRQLWCTCRGQRRTWPTADMDAAAAGLAGLALPWRGGSRPSTATHGQ
ncbi:MAG: hypothetical protein ACRDOA_11235 [Streptosporangiaceae bacterium]